MNPTENNPGDALPILKVAPKGAYVTVGTERAFIGAAQTEGATHLVVMDIAHGVVTFDRMNVAFLQMSRNREDYLWLRLKATHQEILTRLEKTPPSAAGVELLRDAKTWQWWKGQLQRDGFTLLHEPPDPSVKDHAFKLTTYLHDDAMFARISRMAKEGRISVLLADLSDARSVGTVVEGLSRQGVPLSVLDISDLWYGSKADSFLATEATARLVNAFKPIAKTSSVLLMTSWYTGKIHSARGRDYRSNVVNAYHAAYPSNGGAKFARYWDWNYFGSTFGSLAEASAPSRLFERLNRRFEHQGQADPRLFQTLDGKPMVEGLSGRLARYLRVLSRLLPF